MPELVEQMYCAQQIIIPPKFPYILKRFAKAAIKTQPYDLLRWAYEYFTALAEHRPPPVKLRLEYPIYSTEGGLTRGYLKVLANQLQCIENEIPIKMITSIWVGACLELSELHRILCLCEVYMRSDVVRRLHFIAVAGGLLTKNLSHTMILLCETLTKEPDGGSAAIPLEEFLIMYEFLANIDASEDVKYINGHRKGETPSAETPSEIEEEEEILQEVVGEKSVDSFWGDNVFDIVNIPLIDDNYTKVTKISEKMTAPLIGALSRSPSVERDVMIERDDFAMTRHERLMKKIDSEKGEQTEETTEGPKPEAKAVEEAVNDRTVTINVFDEADNPVPLEYFGEPAEPSVHEEQTQNPEGIYQEPQFVLEEQIAEKVIEPTENEIIMQYVKDAYLAREERREELQQSFDALAAIVDRYRSAYYDLGMVAGRQMSTTSAEFIVQHIEKEIMDFIDEQIAILPDPDKKKKKAKPFEVKMIRQLLEDFLTENMDIIVPELEELEEEEEPIPDIVLVYAVPGIGPKVPADIVWDFRDYALDVGKIQNDVFMPRNIRHFMCPPLEAYDKESYEANSPHASIEEEELPTGGRLTQ